jgi:hypothetical protein
MPVQRRGRWLRWATPLSITKPATRPTIDSRSIWCGERATTRTENGRDTSSSTRKLWTESEVSPDSKLSDAIGIA